MNKQDSAVMKLAQTALFAALAFVSFKFLKIDIPTPGGNSTSLHVGNAFCVLASLLLGGRYGAVAGAAGLTLADVMDPKYVVSAPKTFFLKLCIGLVTGWVAHHFARINEHTEHRYVMKWAVIASAAGLGFNVVADPIVGYFYKRFILGQPQQMADALAKMSAVTTLVNAVVSVILVIAVYGALRPALIKMQVLKVGAGAED